MLGLPLEESRRWETFWPIKGFQPFHRSSRFTAVVGDVLALEKQKNRFILQHNEKVLAYGYETLQNYNQNSSLVPL